MPKIKPEKVAGIVALSYLVLIPVAGVLVWRKIQVIDQDTAAMWEQLNMPEQSETARLTNVKKIRRFLGA